MSEVVASGEVRVNLSPKLALSEQQIADKAYRTCSSGSAACGFGGVNVDMGPDGTGEVTMLCSNTLADCGASSVRLQEGLDRLAAQAQAGPTVLADSLKAAGKA